MSAKYSNDTILNVYKTYRDYIQFEAGLVNLRITWILTFNGFLFAAFALIIQQNVIGFKSATVFCVIFSVFGMKTSYIGVNLIRYAQQANHGVHSAFLQMAEPDGSPAAPAPSTKISYKIIWAPSMAKPTFSRLKCIEPDRFQAYQFDDFTLPGLRGGGVVSVENSYSASRCVVVTIGWLWFFLFLGCLYAFIAHDEKAQPTKPAVTETL